MNPIRTLRALTGLTQAELASSAGTSQPTISAYEGGRKSPTFHTLRRLAEAAGLELTVTFHPPLTREDRRSLHLHAAIASRLAEDPDETVRQARRNLERMRACHPTAEPLLREWEALFDGPIHALAAALADPSPHARELRQVTPFGGVLSAAERTEAYRAFAAEEALR